MGWSSKGFPLYLRSHKLPTTHKHSSRSGKGPLPASPNALGSRPPPPIACGYDLIGSASARFQAELRTIAGQRTGSILVGHMSRCYCRWLTDEPDPRDLMRSFPAGLMADFYPGQQA